MEIQMDALNVLCHGYTFEEIAENIDDLPSLYKKKQKTTQKYAGEEKYCRKCEIEMKIIIGVYICDQCGDVGDSVMINEWVDDIWIKRKRSVYIRTKHIKKRLEKYVHQRYITIVFDDFLSVIGIMIEYGLRKMFLDMTTVSLGFLVASELY